MDDRELLELAARAAGHTLGPDWYCLPEGIFINGDDRFSGTEWNPLTDDGDALRLAVKLGIHIRHWVYACEAEDNDGRSTGMIHAREFNSDMGAATRRAIVLAAAAIGREM